MCATPRYAHAMQNAFIESFNGRLRDECLNENLFSSLAEARNTLRKWKEDYNHIRPHSALGNIAPAEFVRQIKLKNTPHDGNKLKPKTLQNVEDTWGAGHTPQII